MNTKNDQNIVSIRKRKYICPRINAIKMDNEISIFMASADPNTDPPESTIQPDQFSFNPFKLH
jgi:hypothetical protein